MVSDLVHYIAMMSHKTKLNIMLYDEIFTAGILTAIEESREPAHGAGTVELSIFI